MFKHTQHFACLHHQRYNVILKTIFAVIAITQPTEMKTCLYAHMWGIGLLKHALHSSFIHSNKLLLCKQIDRSKQKLLMCSIFFFQTQMFYLLNESNYHFSDTIFDVHKTHYVIQPTIFDGQNQRKILTTTRQTVNEFQLDYFM